MPNVISAIRQAALITHCSMIQRCSEELALVILPGAQHMAAVGAGAGAEGGETEGLVGGQLIITPQHRQPRGPLTAPAETGSRIMMPLFTRTLTTVMTHKISSRCR